MLFNFWNRINSNSIHVCDKLVMKAEKIKILFWWTNIAICLSKNRGKDTQVGEGSCLKTKIKLDTGIGFLM